MNPLERRNLSNRPFANKPEEASVPAKNANTARVAGQEDHRIGRGRSCSGAGIRTILQWTKGGSAE